MSTRDKVLSGILGLLILAVLVAIVYTVNSAPAGERFTEFYLLGRQGKADSYPRELWPGEEGRVTLVIVNREYQEMSYRVVVRVHEGQNEEIGPIVMEHGERWEQEVSFVPMVADEEQIVEFLLYKEGDIEPYNSLHLRLDVN